MVPERRRFNLKIWGLALGYFAFYAPYSVLIKTVTSGFWPGVRGSVSGFQLLPSTVIATALVLPGIVTIMGWWKFASRRQLRGISIPFPRRLVFLSGLGTAVIIGTTTLAYTFKGVSILLALLLLRGGVLIIAPTVDLVFKRKVRWFSKLALALALISVFLALTDVGNYQMTLVAALTIAAYLTGYMLRLPCMNSLAKCDDEHITRRYFVEEQMVASILLVAIPAVFAVIGYGSIMMDLRRGFTGLFSSSVSVPGLMVGGLYAVLFFFGTLIYLDRRENTFCIPLNRCSSLLSGILATYTLAFLFGQRPPSIGQLGSLGLILVALLLLSPLHHVQRYATKVHHSLFGAYRLGVDFVADLARLAPVRVTLAPTAFPEAAAVVNDRMTDEHDFRNIRHLLFVCSGNTCRSPMAAAIANAEIAGRLRIPLELGQTNVRALSAGLSPRVGAPMTPEAKQTLLELGFHPNGHRAQNLTVELANQVERIFCMTQAHRDSVLNLVPAAAAKTQCLDPNGDIDDPIGKGITAYLNCAQRIHGLVRMRFDEINLQAGADN